MASKIYRSIYFKCTNDEYRDIHHNYRKRYCSASFADGILRVCFTYEQYCDLLVRVYSHVYNLNKNITDKSIRKGHAIMQSQWYLENGWGHTKYAFPKK